MPHALSLPSPSAAPAAPSGRWARWREHRRQGAGTVAYHLLRRLLERSHAVRWLDVRRHQIIALPPGQLHVPARLPREMWVRELTGADLEQLARLRPANGHGYDQRLEGGHHGLGAFLGERLVAFVWLRRGPALLPALSGCIWQLTAPMAWVYDLYSDPGVLGAIPHLYSHVRLHPPGAGCQLLVGQTEFDNWASRRTHQRMGYEIRATVWNFRLGVWHLHLSRAAGRDGRWRRHRRQALVPLELFTTGMAAPAASALHAVAADDPVAATGQDHEQSGASLPLMEARHQATSGSDSAKSGEPPWLQCQCGRNVSLGDADGPIACACGRGLGERRGGVAAIGAGIGYWGEMLRPQMEALLQQAERVGWRRAVEALLPEDLRAYIADPGRAAFQDVLPVPAQARVLDIGAGLGGIATALARRYDVVAIEGVAERARFIQLRRQQDNLSRLTVIQGDLHRVPLGWRQFDLIVVNGVLEWVALHDPSASPQALQLVFLDRLRELLAPGGRIYLAIENRYGWSELRGTLDHSGLPYTSLMPRFLARWWCARSASYRSHFNVGYRTYTYSHRGYARLFEQAGLHIENTWIATASYNRPTKLVPLDSAAIRFATRNKTFGPGVRGWLRRRTQAWLARDWVWRWIGSDFAFLLAPTAPLAVGGSLEMPRAERGNERQCRSCAAHRSPPSSDQRERPGEKWRATPAPTSDPSPSLARDAAHHA